MQQENIQVLINDVTNEVQTFLFQCAKYEKSTQSNMLMNAGTQDEIRRITEKYEVENKKKNKLEEQKAKQERLKPRPEDVIRETLHKEYEDSMMQNEEENDEN